MSAASRGGGGGEGTWERDPWKDSVRPPLSWRVARWVSWVCAGAAILVGLLWVLARVMTDRTLATQYLFWVPAEIFVAAFVVLVMFAGGLRWFARKRRWWWRVGTLMLIVMMLAHLSFVRYRVQGRVFGTGGTAGGAAGATVAVQHWNAAGVFDAVVIQRVLAGVDADVFVVTNPDWGTRWDEVLAAADAWRVGEKRRFTRFEEFGVISAWPIARAGATTLEIAGAGADIDELVPLDRRGPRQDPGRAMYVEFGGSGNGLDRGLVVWAIDMPSDPRLWRWPMAEQGRRAIAAFRGTESVWEGGQRRREESKGFPEPDVIVGDFNTPRGSASLGVMVPSGFRHAYDEAGHGDASTWPRSLHWSVRPKWWPRWPMFHIDHTFVSPRWRAVGYEILDPGGLASHQMQRAVLVRQKT